MNDDYTPPKVWTPGKENGGQFASINKPTAGAQFDRDLPVGKHPLQLYSLATPNGQKVTIMLEELLEAGHDAEYDAWLIRINEGDQFGSGFVAVNPNSKIPALMDHSVSPPQRVFESGSILLYLAEKYGAFLPTDRAGRTETLNWLFWQMGAGPYLGGGFGHFYAYAPSKIEYAIDRFTMEVKRQLDLLDKRLAETRFVAGEDYTIADMAIWPWYGRLVTGGAYGDAATFLDAQSYRNVHRWQAEIAARPAVWRGIMVNATSGDPAKQLHERHDASDFQTRTQDKLKGLQRKDVVAMVNYLENQGMNKSDYSQLHHFSLTGRNETFAQTKAYWSQDDEIGSKTNFDFAARLEYIVSGHKRGEAIEDLAKRSLLLYPLQE